MVVFSSSPFATEARPKTVIETRAQQLIDNSDPSMVLTLIVSWLAAADLSAARNLATRRERAAAAEKAYGILKWDLIRRFSELNDVVVVDLPGTGQAIVSATPPAWRELVPFLQSLNDVRVSPNDVVDVMVRD